MFSSKKLYSLSALSNFISELLNFLPAFVFKTFHLVFPILTPLSRENIIETLLTSKECCLAKFCKVDV